MGRNSANAALLVLPRVFAKKKKKETTKKKWRSGLLITNRLTLKNVLCASLLQCSYVLQSRRLGVCVFVSRSKLARKKHIAARCRLPVVCFLPTSKVTFLAQAPPPVYMRSEHKITCLSSGFSIIRLFPKYVRWLFVEQACSADE